jgi:hypothetical protein
MGTVGGDGFPINGTNAGRKMMIRNSQSFSRTLMFLLAVCGGATLAGDFEMIRSTIDGGGAMRSTGGTFELSGTIGQSDAGTMVGGSFDLSGGFWFAVAPSDLDEDGGVSLLDYETFVACLSGPDAGVVSGCESCDVNRDGTVDLRDFYELQAAFTGS